MKKALITGITGQDGSFLAEFLLAKGYEVHGLIRRASTFNTERLDAIYADPHERGVSLFLHYGDLTDGTGLRRTIGSVRPDEIYNLAAQSHVRVSFDQPEYTADVVGMGTLRLLEALRDYISVSGQTVKFYQAGSSEMYGAASPPQNERTAFYPRSPSAASKVDGHWYAVNYREAYGMFVSNGILFNHESERRGETFVTRKITRALGRIKTGLQDKLFLGTWNRGETGASPGIMWKLCGSCCSSPRPTILLSQQEKHTLWLNSWMRPLCAAVWTGINSSRPMPATIARPKSTTCWGMRRKRGKN